jgi:hypothetical protein
MLQSFETSRPAAGVSIIKTTLPGAPSSAARTPPCWVYK